MKSIQETCRLVLQKFNTQFCLIIACLPAVPRLHRLCLSLWVELSGSTGHSCGQGPGHCLLCEWALPLQPMEGSCVCGAWHALTPEAQLGKGQERACWLARPKLELLNVRVKEYGQLEESAPCKPSPSSILQTSPDVPSLQLLRLPPIAGWNFLHRKFPY